MSHFLVSRSDPVQTDQSKQKTESRKSTESALAGNRILFPSIFVPFMSFAAEIPNLHHDPHIQELHLHTKTFLQAFTNRLNAETLGGVVAGEDRVDAILPCEVVGGQGLLA